MKFKKRTSKSFLKILMVCTTLFLVQCDLRQDIFFPLENSADDPVFSPAGGTYNSDQSIAISCSTPGTVIRYTTDGSDPSGSSSLYTTAIPVAGHNTDITIRAVAISSEIMNSKILQNDYKIRYQAADPVFNIPGGIHTSDKSVAISCSTPGATIYYTTDGSTPTAASAVYSTAIDVSGNGAHCTLSAFAVAAGHNDSTVVSNPYKIRYVIYFVSGMEAFWSIDDGANWLTKGLGVPVSTVHARGNDIFTGGTSSLFYSPDGGVNWETKAYSGEMTSISFLGSTVYFSNNSGGGLLYSINLGDTIAGPVLTTDQRSVQSDGSILYLATSQGVYFSRGSSGLDIRVFSHTNSPVGSPIIVSQSILSDNTFDVFPLGNYIYIASDAGVSVFNMTDSSVTNYTMTEGLASNQVNGICSDGTWIYAATDAGLSIYNGASWNTMISGVVCNRVRLVGSVVYVATEDGVYVSYDQGATWNNHYGGLSVPDIHAAARP